ncbi:MAG: hypothetical protein JRH06_03075 [Deltaproteobacteria bacterium]|nr:hypothetical protein [Deltaproteobacteria bacterium]MBW2136521.1 hypothetical protein [Deltaproteobacteria bacterium]
MNERMGIPGGLDAGHVSTKAVIMKGQEILGHSKVPTGFDAGASARKALNDAADSAGISCSELGGIVTTGIFRDVVGNLPWKRIRSVPEYEAAAKGALFLNGDSRTVIDIGGNVHMAIHYDQKGDLLDVVQNDKCADGLGIFYTRITKAMGLSEQEMSDLALESNDHLSIGVHCAQCAESDAIDLLCQGKDIRDVAGAVTGFMAERVAAICTYMPLTKEIVAMGGLARSRALIMRLRDLIGMDITVLDLPEYAVALGAVMSCEGER